MCVCVCGGGGGGGGGLAFSNVTQMFISIYFHSHVTQMFKEFFSVSIKSGN